MSVALGLLVVSPLNGQAPASVAGTIFHYAFKAPGPLTPVTTRIAVLRSDGTYADLRRAAAGALTQGSYTYATNSDSEGTLVTTADGGAVSTYRITFSSDSAGSIITPGSPYAPSVWFGPLFPDAPLVNSSQRSWVSDDEPGIVGFSIPPNRQSIVLVRAIGPGLAAFAGTTPAADPRLEVYRSDGSSVDANDDWEQGHRLLPAFPADTPLSDVRLAESLTGAFPLAAGSKDAALVLWLGAAGNYTVHVRTAAGEPRAEVLAEVYVIE